MHKGSVKGAMTRSIIVCDVLLGNLLQDFFHFTVSDQPELVELLMCSSVYNALVICRNSSMFAAAYNDCAVSF